MSVYIKDGEMTFDEIASELGITGNYARVLYVKAMKKLVVACRRYGLSPEDIIGKPAHMLARLEDHA